MKKVYQYVAIAAMAFAAQGAWAQNPAPAQNQDKHEGLYLNATGGLGLLGFSEAIGTTTVSMSGMAFQYGAKVGGAINENLVIFGAIDGFSASNPSVKVTTGTASASGSSTNTTYSVLMFGAGLAFYTDSNFFISLTAGIAKGSISIGSTTTSTDSGFGANVSLGQEWWVARDFGIGAALVGHFSSVKDAGTYTVTQYYIGIAVSATYN